jgi:hypothetical protein
VCISFTLAILQQRKRRRAYVRSNGEKTAETEELRKDVRENDVGLEARVGEDLGERSDEGGKVRGEEGELVCLF